MLGKLGVGMLECFELRWFFVIMGKFSFSFWDLVFDKVGQIFVLYLTVFIDSRFTCLNIIKI